MNSQRGSFAYKSANLQARERFFGFTSLHRLALLYLAALLTAECITNWVAPSAGWVLYSTILIALLLQAALGARSTQWRFSLALALIPLARLLSLSLPQVGIPEIYQTLLIGIPLLLASFTVARTGRFQTGMLGLTSHALPFQGLVAITGIGLGYIEYQILRPSPIISEYHWEEVCYLAFNLLVFTGFLEEFIFRGLLQYATLRSFGWLGLFYPAMVCAMLHLSYRVWLDVLFVFGVGLYFGWAAWRSGSLFGVSLAHGLANIGLFLIFPLWLASPGNPPVAYQATPVMLPAPAENHIFQPATDTSQTDILAVVAPATDQFAPSPTPTITPSPCPRPAGWVPYEVRTGDNLDTLSWGRGVRKAELRRANCLVTGQLFTGQTIYLPPLAPTLPFYISSNPPYTATSFPVRNPLLPPSNSPPEFTPTYNPPDATLTLAPLLPSSTFPPSEATLPAFLPSATHPVNPLNLPTPTSTSITLPPTEGPTLTAEIIITLPAETPMVGDTPSP